MSAKHRLLGFGLVAGFVTFTAGPPVLAQLADAASLDRLGLKRYWEVQVPLVAGDQVQRMVLLDDNVYLLSVNNFAAAVHARTGVHRWIAQVADPERTLRGPTHSQEYVLFTGPASVKVLHRRTGEFIGEPRTLRGAIIEVSHDVATISIGRAHGVRRDDLLGVYPAGDPGSDEGEPIAKLKVTLVEERQSQGTLLKPSRSTEVRIGHQVRGNVVLPLESIKLPFAASGPATADSEDLFVGAANERLFSIRLLTGFLNWQLMTPGSLSSAPVVRHERVVEAEGGKRLLEVAADDPKCERRSLYFAGQDGAVVSIVLLTSLERSMNWSFQTEGPIFADLLVEPEHVYVASSDRQLYCLDRLTGRRVWRERFDNRPADSPRVAGGRIFHSVVQGGLYVLDALTGASRWERPQGGRLLAQLEDRVFLAETGSWTRLVRADAATGQRETSVDLPRVDFIVASQEDGLLVLADRAGRMMAVRPKSAPPLSPAELADVLRDDQRASMLAQATSAKRASETSKAAHKVEDRPLPKLTFLDEDEWLRSRSTAQPVGGRGLIEAEPGPGAEEEADEPAEGERAEDEPEDEEPEDEAEEDGEVEEEDEGKEDEEDWGEEEDEEGDGEEEEEEGEEEGEADEGDEEDEEDDEEAGGEDER